MKNFRLLSSMTAVAMLLTSFTLPTGWFTTGSKVKNYEMGIAAGEGRTGGNAATIKSIDKKIEGFGALMQQCSPGSYSGKRIRLSGYLKSENVKNNCGLWLRVDQAGTQRPQSFDNMNKRPVKGTTEWTKYEIVLDVPETASMLAYGALLNGTGQVWFDDLTFEVVSADVPVTGQINGNKIDLLKEPVNLDFEKN